MSGGGGGVGDGDRRVGCHRGGHRGGDHEGLGGAVGQRGQGAVDALPAGGGAGLAGRRVGDGGDVQAGVNRVGDVHRGGVAGAGVGDIYVEFVPVGVGIHRAVLEDLLDGEGHVAG